ncbi:hypothetical protein GCM10027275_42680 [Rhabdobacter roseus]|uniref:Heme exporter protein D n=1 Tax=Rhabdobacter roseus TaxID=1655419 RepID=A0A840TXD9_9BACT|nr:YMGG-like glycine zipper-containing protein [Rhabdobacter roseus]MBB5286247.1 heme exporter protein D [Rhabdobacter roseus]
MKKLVIVFSVVAVMSSCQHSARQEARLEAATADSLAREAEIQQAKQATIDSMRIAQLEEELAAKEREEANRANQPATVVVQQRKGMNNTAKGALIGAGVGAATGALVSKKRGQGALIGGAVGAGGGAATGAVIDNRKKRRN